MKRGPKPSPELDARNERMAQMYRQGVTLEKIGAQFGITRERVRQVLKRFGVTSQEGGKCAQVAMAGGSVLQRNRAAARRAQEARWGVAYDLLCVLRSEGLTAAYRSHEKSAAARGIAFDLTLSQWWAIWQASGHAHERGRGKGKYCMSRMSDAGGYTLGNVHIQPCVENSRDAVSKWKDKPAKKNPGVFLLYPGLATPYLAKVGKARLGLFATEDEAVAARVAYVAEHGIRHGTGSGRGWTFVKANTRRPYQMQALGVSACFATQQEAEAAYRAACEAHLDRLRAAAPVESHGAA